MKRFKKFFLNELPGAEISKAAFALRLLGGSCAGWGSTVLISSRTFSEEAKIGWIKSNAQLGSLIRVNHLSLGFCCFYSTITQVSPLSFFYWKLGCSLEALSKFLLILFTSRKVMDGRDASGFLPIYSEFKMSSQECARLCQGLKLYHRFYKCALTNPNIIYNSGFLGLKVWDIVFPLEDKRGRRKFWLKGGGKPAK